jgi:tetratricopeptide (TPR) repeat protein
VLIFIAGTVLDLPARFHRAIALGAGFAVLALSLRSAERSSDWTTPEHFYKQTMAAGGISTRVRLNLAQLYATRGEYARAESIFRQILLDYPGYPIAQTDLASALFHEGKKKEAEALFAASTATAARDRKEYARTWLAALNLAGMRQQQGDSKGALTILEKARADYPRVWEIVSFESETLRSTGKPAAAIHLVEKFRSENWWSYPASLALGQLYAQNGETEKAAAALHRASELDVHEVEALNRLAELRVRENRLADACVTQRRAVARQPDRPREYLYLSRILEKMGRSTEAQEAVATVARLETSARDFNAVATN